MSDAQDEDIPVENMLIEEAGQVADRYVEEGLDPVEAARALHFLATQFMGDRNIGNTNEISSFFHCRKCIEEIQSGFAPDESPQSYARHSVGFTPLGLQIWCNRHDINIAHIDFQGCQHPANLSAEKPKIN